MKAFFEVVQPDAGSSFRLLHHKVPSDTFRWNYHYHPEYEIVYVLNGAGRRHVGHHLSYYTDGDLVLIGSDTPHSGFGYGSVGIHEEIVIQFNEHFLGENFLHRPEFIEIKALLERSKRGIAFHGDIFEELREPFLNLSQLEVFDRLLMLLKILKKLAHSTEAILLNSADIYYNFSLKDQSRLNKISRFVEDYYREEINLAEVADLVGLTVPAFCNYFKKNVNQTFTEFVNEYRINQACDMLIRGNDIPDICFQCGFNNVSYFGRIFKELKGKTPSQFRRAFPKSDL